MDRFGSSHGDRIWLYDTAVQTLLDPTLVLDHNVLAPLRSLTILHYCPQGSKRMEAHLVGYHQSCRIRCARRGAAANGATGSRISTEATHLATFGWRGASQMAFHSASFLITTSMYQFLSPYVPYL